MASKPAASRTAAGSAADVRRNLFHHQLSRRPTSASTSNSGITWQDPLPDDKSDIVVKDRNGNYDIHVPILQPLVDDEQAPEEDMVGEREKLDAMMLERFKDRSLQPGEPGGMYMLEVSVLAEKANLHETQNCWLRYKPV